jgi:GDP-L-fucose synthase
MNIQDKIYVAGHNGMVGSAIVRKLKKEGFNNIVFKSSKELDLRNQAAVESFFNNEKLDYVFLTAAKVGGIKANNTYKADFLYDNLMIQNNVINSAYHNGVKKLLFTGSSCIYPKFCPQPIKEEYLLTGALEPTNEPYAIAKIAGLKLVESIRSQHGVGYISVMPTNLYGPGDNYDLNNSHVLPAMIRKFHDAKKTGKDKVEIWGTGTPYREFLHVDDLADACFYLMENYEGEVALNIGTGKDLSIKDLALLVKKVVGYNGDIYFNTDMPDGTPKKQLDVSKLHKLGWKHKIELEEGIKSVYDSVKTQLDQY